MTGFEFKNLAEEYIGNKNITVFEHEKMFKKLKTASLNILRKFLGKYLHYFIEVYSVDWGFEPDNVYDVEFSKGKLTFAYWDDSSAETSSFVDIPIADFVKWIDNDVDCIHEFIIKDIKRTLKNQIENDKKRIKYYQDSVDDSEQFLSKIDSMEFNDIKNWYDRWIDNAI